MNSFNIQEALKKANEDYEASKIRFIEKRIELGIEQRPVFRREETEFDILNNSKNQRPEKERLFKQQSGLCALCKLPMTLKQATIDHIIPKSKGGSNDISNKQLAHSVCNNIKGDSLEVLRPTQYADLYHERKMTW